MRKLLLYMRQLSQRRLSAFEFLPPHGDEPEGSNTHQLVLDYGHQDVDARALRRRIAEAEYDDETA
ncbi:hypothetical protein GCM10023144_00050 [Pigmentiphaga soli]|uniref:Uncharacterized protein n=1 Tax=Pigmentiphaga soli TaxID=1007095 RepID=A0ABP8GBD5_9BURK